MRLTWPVGLMGGCALVLAVPVMAGAVTQIQTFDAGQIRGCEVPAIGAEFFAEELDYGELDLDGEPAAEGPIASERNTFTADGWALFDGSGTTSVQVVVGKMVDQYFETDESGKYKVRWYDASGSLFLGGQTYEMEGCQVKVWHQ